MSVYSHPPRFSILLVSVILGMLALLAGCGRGGRNIEGTHVPPPAASGPVSFKLDLQTSDLTLNQVLLINADCSYPQIEQILGKPESCAKLSPGLSATTYNWSSGVEATFCESSGRLLTMHGTISETLRLSCGEHVIESKTDFQHLPGSWTKNVPDDTTIISGHESGMNKVQVGMAGELLTFSYTYMANVYGCAGLGDGKQQGHP